MNSMYYLVLYENGGIVGSEQVRCMFRMCCMYVCISAQVLFQRQHIYIHISAATSQHQATTARKRSSATQRSRASLAFCVGHGCTRGGVEGTNVRTVCDKKKIMSFFPSSVCCCCLTICKLDAGRATDRTASEGAMKALVPAMRQTRATNVERTLVNMLS